MAGQLNYLIDHWNTWPVQMVFWGAVLAIMLVVSFFVLRKLRDSAVGNEEAPLELLTNFREMKLQGDISDKEFRTIKALLNDKQAPTIKQTQDST
jgi:uncharacterized membrane protein